MDITNIINRAGFYVFTVVSFYSCLASFSYAYYVRKTRASSEQRNLFQANLNPPFKWLFLGKKPFFERILLSTALEYRSFEDYIDNVPQSEIIFYRITCTIGCLLPMLMILVLFVVPGKDLIGQFIIDLIVQVLTLFVSLRFGHKLISSDKDALQ